MRRLWIPLLLAVLVAALVGPGVVTAAEPRVTVRTVMIPAAAFIPYSSDADYYNNGIYVEANSGQAVFTAPLTFPVQTVTIRKITLFAYDNSGTYGAWASLYRTYPAGAVEKRLGGVQTYGASPEDPQVLSNTAISPRLINTANYGAYLWVGLDGPGIYVYGVQIQYSY